MLAHELRNPLAPIRNAVHLQKLLPATDPAHATWRAVIERQSSQLSHIVDDLLDIGRITRGTLSIDRKPVAVAAIVERAIEAARPAIDAAHHTLHVELPAAQLEISYGDEVRLTQGPHEYSQQCSPLHRSRRSYLHPGLHDRNCRPEARSPSPCAIPGGALHPIFSSRSSECSCKEKELLNRPAGGLGVGLALARSIVELHHGTVEANSAGRGKGAEFIIRLPVTVGQ